MVEAIEVGLSVLVAVEMGIPTVAVNASLTTTVGISTGVARDRQAVAPNNKAPPNTPDMNLFMGSIPGRADPRLRSWISPGS